MSNFKYEIKGAKCYLNFGNGRMMIPWKERWIPATAEVTTYPTKIKLDQSTLTLGVGGESAQLTATVTPSTASGTLNWKSSKKAVATVSDDGLVAPVAVGSATITCSSSLDSTIKATCSVTVLGE